MQAGFGLGAEPPDAGIAVPVVEAVLQRQLRLANAAHAVQGGPRQDGGAAAVIKLFVQAGQQVIGVLEIGAEAVFDDMKQVFHTGRGAIAGLGHAGHCGEALAQTHELIVPIRLFALEYVGIQLAQRREAGLQVWVKLMRSRHGRAAEQDRQHQNAVATPPKRAFNLAADEINTRLVYPSVDLGQPVRADEHQHHGGGVDGGGDALREIVADVDTVLVIKQGVGVEPMAEFAKQAAGMASCVMCGGS